MAIRGLGLESAWVRVIGLYSEPAWDLHVSPKGTLLGRKWRCINTPALAPLTLTAHLSMNYLTIYSVIQHMLIFVMSNSLYIPFLT